MDRCDVEPGTWLHENQRWLSPLLRRNVCRTVSRCPYRYARLFGAFFYPKKSNIYGLIFGSQHPLGIHKFLQVAWANDKIAGEANYDIERENIGPSEGILPFEMMRPNKTRAFEKDLEETLRNRIIKTEADVVRFCIEAGMTCQHSSSVLKRLKAEKVIDINFWVPDVRNLKTPRPIRMV